jgi:hypothetical protein
LPQEKIQEVIGQQVKHWDGKLHQYLPHGEEQTRQEPAIGTPAIWAQMEQDCITKGEIPWISQESPKRPPQLPLFGKVKAFLFDSATLVNEVRPGPATCDFFTAI